jgi:hypothetical protein
MIPRIGTAFLVCALFLGLATMGGVHKAEVYHAGGTVLSSLPTMGHTRYDMVVISPDVYSAALQPLIEHKNSHNVATILMSTEDLYSDYEGSDEAEQIKYCIKDALDTWNIQYVLLVGDPEIIPMRNSAVRCSWYTFTYVPTDLYYADIYDVNMSFCSWDSNDNDVFGEYTWDMSHDRTEYIDVVDLYPDVGVGRLPCSLSSEVDAMVEKIISYETQTYGQDWFHRILLLGGDTHSQHEGNEGEIVTEYVANIMTDFEPIRLWTSTQSFRPLRINRAISDGVGFVSYSGHGNEYKISTFIPGTERAIRYYAPYIWGLTNNERLPIVFLDCCLTGNLEFHVFNVKIPCFAWALVKKPSGGAIAAIGASRMGYGGLVGDPLGGGTCRMNANFFEAYEPGITVSDMFMKAQRAYLDTLWKDCFTLEEFNLIGDPSLKIGGYPA